MFHHVMDESWSNMQSFTRCWLKSWLETLLCHDGVAQMQTFICNRSCVSEGADCPSITQSTTLTLPVASGGGQDSFTVWSVTILGSNLIFWFTQHTFWVLFRRSRTAPGLLTSVVLIGTSVSLEILVVPSLRWGHYSSIRFLKTVSLVLISVSIFYSIHEHTGRAGRAYSLSQETEIIVREYIRSFYS